MVYPVGRFSARRPNLCGASLLSIPLLKPNSLGGDPAVLLPKLSNGIDRPLAARNEALSADTMAPSSWTKAFASHSANENHLETLWPYDLCTTVKA